MADKPRWGWIEILLVYICITAVGFLVSFFSGGLAKFSAGLGMGEAGYFLVVFAIQFIATVALVWFFGIVTCGADWSQLGLRAARLPDFITYGLLGGVVLIFTVIVLGYGVKLVQPEVPPQYFEQVLRSSHSLKVFLPVLTAGAVLAPFSEELFYRGMIYPVARARFGPVGGAVLAGLLFGLAHFDVWRTLPLAVGGAGLCYIYEKSGSILVSTVAHGVWNGFMAMVIFLSVSHGLL